MRSETGEGAVTRAVAEKGTGTRIGTWTGTRTKSGMAEERRRTAKTSNRGVDAIRHFHSARVIISADRGYLALGGTR